MCWSEQITEHLENCTYCRGRLDKLFLPSEIWKVENAVAAIRLVEKEEEINKRRSLCVRKNLFI